MLRVLLDSMTPETLEQIRRGVPADRYELMSTDEIRGLEEAVRARHPHIAVLGRIHEQQDEASRKIESL